MDADKFWAVGVCTCVALLILSIATYNIVEQMRPPPPREHAAEMIDNFCLAWGRSNR